MKHLRRVLIAVAASTAVAIVVPTAQAAAAPAQAAPSPYLTAGFSKNLDGVVATLRDGVFRPNAARSSLDIVNRVGTVVDSVPLVGTMDGHRVPLRWSANADRSSVTLTPTVSAGYRTQLTAASTEAAKKQSAKPRKKRITKQQRYTMMWKELNKGWKDFTPASTLIGGLIGLFVFGPIGAAIGAGIGAYIGYQTTNPKAWPAVVAWWNTP